MAYYTWRIDTKFGPPFVAEKGMIYAQGLLTSRGQALDYVGAPADHPDDVWETFENRYTLVRIGV